MEGELRISEGRVFQMVGAATHHSYDPGLNICWLKVHITVQSNTFKMKTVCRSSKIAQKLPPLETPAWKLPPC